MLGKRHRRPSLLKKECNNYNFTFAHPDSRVIFMNLSCKSGWDTKTMYVKIMYVRRWMSIQLGYLSFGYLSNDFELYSTGRGNHVPDRQFHIFKKFLATTWAFAEYFVTDSSLSEHRSSPLYARGSLTFWIQSRVFNFKKFISSPFASLAHKMREDVGTINIFNHGKKHGICTIVVYTRVF